MRAWRSTHPRRRLDGPVRGVHRRAARPGAQAPRRVDRRARALARPRAPRRLPGSGISDRRREGDRACDARRGARWPAGHRLRLARGPRLGPAPRRRRTSLLLPYGSAFPLEAWPAIRGFLKAGGGLVVLGGAPFEQPVRRLAPAADGDARLRPRHPPAELRPRPADRPGRPRRRRRLRGAAPHRTGRRLRLGGHAAPARARLRAHRAPRHAQGPAEREAAPRACATPCCGRCVHVLDRGRAAARPARCSSIDRLRGADAGARWVLAPVGRARSTRPTIRQAIAARARGRRRSSRRGRCGPRSSPARCRRSACCVSRPAPRARRGRARARARRASRDDAGPTVFEGELALAGPAEQRTGIAAARAPQPLPPGLYHVTRRAARRALAPARDHDRLLGARTSACCAPAPRLSRVSRLVLRKDGQVLPVVGTTYMASDVHRKFLFEPNPHVWDRDFAEMARQGVNFVRTGLWTAWSRAMLDPGAHRRGRAERARGLRPDRGAPRHRGVLQLLRLPAAGLRRREPVPRPARARGPDERSSRCVASRFRGVGWVHWDLINEPSYAPADSLWTNQPVGDALERRAFARLAHARGTATTPVALRDRWRDAGRRPLRAAARGRRPRLGDDPRGRAAAEGAATSRRSRRTSSRAGRRRCATCCARPAATRW